jgi:hypothetical protein
LGQQFYHTNAIAAAMQNSLLVSYECSTGGVMTNEENYDAYKPGKIAALVQGAGVSKAQLPLFQMFVLAVLAGAFIGFGGAAYTAVSQE